MAWPEAAGQGRQLGDVGCVVQGPGWREGVHGGGGGFYWVCCWVAGGDNFK